MAKKIVSIYIDDSSIRIMETDGRQIKKWGETTLEPGSVDNTLIVKEAEVATKIKDLLKEQKITTNKVAVGISGLRCLSRPLALPQLPKEMLDEAVRREAKRALPVPLEQLYLSWQVIPGQQGKTQVFLLAIPTQTVDTLVKVLHQAGVSPTFLDIKPLLLARASREPTAVIVDVQKTEFDIVIMTDGIPQPIRSISFHNESQSWQEKVAMIGKELDRTIQFYNSNNPEKAFSEKTPIMASGELAGSQELCQALAAQINHAVEPMPSPLESPESFPVNKFMVNISLVIQGNSSGGKAGAAAVILNALPVVYRPKPVLLTGAFAMPGAAVAIALLAFVMILSRMTATDIIKTQEQIKSSEIRFQQKVAQRGKLNSSITDLEKKITTVNTTYNDFTRVVNNISVKYDQIYEDLRASVKGLPIMLTDIKINQAGSVLTATGQAATDRDVILYLKQLDKSENFQEITIADMRALEAGGMSFSIKGGLQDSENTSSTVIALNQLPTSANLTSVTSVEGVLTLNGQSPNEDTVLNYLKYIESTSRFNPIAYNIKENEAGSMDFTLVLKVGG